MSLLEDKLIELDFFPHSDLFISWPYVIKESLSTETGRGYIRIKYSDVPIFVYVLASKIGTDFISEKILEEAKRTSFISFANCEYTELYQHIKFALGYKQKLWELLGDEKTKDQIYDEQLRYLKEKFPDCEYIGFIPPSAEYSSLDILYKDDNIYLTQRKNILRLNKELSKEILKRTVEHYGVAVSPALRPILERL